MIISRAPVRITLGGGGTDLESYYSKYGGFLVTAAIDKYVFIAANRRFYDSIRLSYSETEIVDSVDDARHSIFREALRFLRIDSGIELVSIADVPANCGLGSSSSFTVSLLNALHAYKREFVSQRQLAEEAYHLEVEVLHAPIGKQDQYISAFGGVTCLTFEPNGQVMAEPLSISDEDLDQLQNSIRLFHTGIERSASEVLAEQDRRSRQEDGRVIENLHHIKEIGLKSQSALEQGDLRRFGELLDLHWQTKKALSEKASNPFLEKCYQMAIEAGVLGGKVVGAGAGGFFLFYCEPQHHSSLSEAMNELGLKPMRFRFDLEGAKIMVNMKGR